MIRLVPVSMIFKVVMTKVTQKVKRRDRGTAEPCYNGPNSIVKYLKSGFSCSPLIFFSFLLLFIITMTDFGNK